MSSIMTKISDIFQSLKSKVDFSKVQCAMGKCDNALRKVKGKKKMYRFALFGLSGSGKTCILTAMGAACRATEDEIYCSAMPAKYNESPDILEGWNNLQKHVQDLENSNGGKLPVPTPPTQGNYPRYRYKYSDTQRGESYFEIIDYAGELIETTNLTEEHGEELLKQMTKHDIDAIIVLVSVPCKGEDDSEITNEIGAIVTAFNFLQSQQVGKRRYPFALVFTKWDRQWETGYIPPNDKDAESARLATFFKKYPAYEPVHNVLKGSTSEGLFQVFPVSALGPCSDGLKPDKMKPLDSYGLPFVFGWLIQTTNEICFQQFKKRCQWGAAVVLIFCILWSWVLWESDRIMLAKADTLVKNPKANVDDIERTESKLDTYIHSSFLYPLPLRLYPGKSTAEYLREYIVRMIPDVVVKRFLAIPLENNDKIQKEGPDILERFPNLSEQDKVKVLSRMKEAQEVHRKKQEEIAIKNAEKEWADFEKSVRASFDGGEIATTLSSLSQRNPKDENWKELCNDILSRTTEAIKSRAKSLGTLYDSVRTEVKNSQASVRLLSNDRVAKADEVLRELNDFLAQVDKDHDKDLYSRAKNRRTKSACDDYLNNAPLKTMRQYVERYKNYIEEQSEAVSVKVTATLEVGNKIYWATFGSSNRFSLSVNGKEKISIKDLNDIGFKKNETLRLVKDSFSIKGKLQDIIKVDVRIAYKNLFRDKDQGNGSKSFTINELANSVSIPLQSKDDTGVKHTLTLQATGFPNEPKLPEWRP